MRKEKPFEVAKPRTPKGKARVRERIALDAMRTLTEIGDEETFKNALNLYGLKPGEPRYDAALRAWRLAQASK